MKKRYLIPYMGITIMAFLAFTNVSAQENKSIFHAGLVYPLSTHGARAGEYSNSFSLHAIAGVSAEERAFTVSGISTVIKQNANGFQAAGIVNTVGGNSRGFLVAGILNTYKSGNGFQAAGIVNLAKDSVTGFQAAGYYNSAAHVNGTQASGFMNCAGDVEGAQIAGFINMAGKVKGVQISGFINIADSSQYPIGIINIIRNGERSLGLTTDDNATTLVTFRSGSKKLYGIIGLGSNFKNNKEVFAFQTGFGAHLITRKDFRLNAELTGTMLENFKKGEFSKYSLAVLPAWHFGKLEVFAGPSFNFITTDSSEGRKLVDNPLWDHNTSNDRLNALYFGFTGGVQWSL